MYGKAAPSAKGTARNVYRAGEQRDRNKFDSNSQSLVAGSGGVLDTDAANDALAWGRALEADAAHFLHRRARRG